MVTLAPSLRHLAAALAWAVAAAAAAPAWAATPIMIWPVDPVITGSQRAVALWLENRGSTPVTMQVRVFQWRQADGQDQFENQRDVVASPPISQIPPGQRQMVRLLATQPVPPRAEQTFRVLVDELPAPDPLAPEGAASIPGPPERATADAAAVAVRLQIRYAIPLFVYGPDTLPRRLADARSLIDGTAVLEPELSWDLQPQGRTSQVVLHNRGPGHARITSAGWTRAGAPATPSKDVLNYVLPQSQMPLDVAAPPSPGHTLTVTVNGREAQLPRASQ